MSNEDAVPLTDEQIAALKAAALAATPQDIDSAQDIERFPDGSRYCTCPACDGEGHVDLEADYCNYDGHALGVQFYGIGDAHKFAEDYFRAAKPATVLALIERLERAEATPQADAAIAAGEAREADGRESFEAAWKQEYPLHGESAFKRSGFNPDAYVNTRVQDGWLMWQARGKTGSKASPLPRVAETVPPEVMAALDRMCTPLDKSVLKGATADADAHSMRIIRDYVLRATPQARTNVALTDDEREDLQEAREILENMLSSIEADGNYSTEATCTFLRQALNCLPAASPAAGTQDEKRCEYCDGTGDVHRIDGEWRGTCTACDAADSQTAARAADGGEQGVES
jgi:hypothetical protein